MEQQRVAVVTGASAGIGAATARALADAGYHVVLGARGVERLEAVAREVGGTARRLDVTDAASVRAFCEGIDRCDVLVNNAGGAIGLDLIADSEDEDWVEMHQRNVMSVVRMVRELLPRLREAEGTIVNIGSTAAHFVYPGGAGYTSAKHAERAVTKTLRGELLGSPVRVVAIDPGMVETEFSLVRFGGDDERARQVYEGMQPLRAADVAACVAFAVGLPPYVNIDELVVTPRDQVLGQGMQVHRGP